MSDYIKFANGDKISINGFEFQHDYDKCFPVGVIDGDDIRKYNDGISFDLKLTGHGKKFVRSIFDYSSGYRINNRRGRNSLELIR